VGLALHEVPQGRVLAEEFASLHVLLTEAGEENFRRAVAVAVIGDADVTVWSPGDVGVGDVVAFIEEQLAGPGLAAIGGKIPAKPLSSPEGEV
jgi:hypothetical protein